MIFSILVNVYFEEIYYRLFQLITWLYYFNSFASKTDEIIIILDRKLRLMKKVFRCLCKTVVFIIPLLLSRNFDGSLLLLEFYDNQSGNLIMQLVI